MPSVPASAAVEHLHEICEVQWEADSKWADIGCVSGSGGSVASSSSSPSSCSSGPVVVLPRQVVSFTVHFCLRTNGPSYARTVRALLCELGETSIETVWKRLFRRVTVVPFFCVSSSDSGKDGKQGPEVPLFQACAYGEGEPGFGCSSAAPRGTRSEAAKGKTRVVYGVSNTGGTGDTLTPLTGAKDSRRVSGEPVPTIKKLVTTIRVNVGVPDSVVGGEKCCAAFSFLLCDTALPSVSLLPTPLGYSSNSVAQQQQQEVGGQQVRQQQHQAPPTSQAFLLPSSSVLGESDAQRRRQKSNGKATSSMTAAWSAARALLLPSSSSSSSAAAAAAAKRAAGGGGGAGGKAGDDVVLGEVIASLAVPRAFQCPSVFFGTLYQPVVVVRLLSYDVVSRRVSASRVLVNVMVTNVSGVRVAVTECRFDLWSTTVGSGGGSGSGSGSGKREHGSLADIPAHVGQRVAPSGNSDVATVELLAEVVSTVRISTTSGALVLEPLETYSIQYAVQVKPHLCYLAGSSSGDVDANALSSLSGVVNAACGGSGGYGSDQLSPEKEAAVSRLLALPFVSQLYVYYDPIGPDRNTGTTTTTDGGGDSNELNVDKNTSPSSDLHLSCPVTWSFKN